MSVMRFAILLAAALLAGLPSARASSWGPEVRITNAVGHSWAPRLATWNGVVHAVWFDYVGAGADAEILYARSVDNGTTWSAPVNISADGAKPDLDPVVAADASGVYVAWNSDVTSGDLYLRRSLDQGASWLGVQRLTSTAGYSRAGDLMIDGSGVVHVVYYDDRVGHSDIWHRQSCDHGATWAAEQNVTLHDGVVDNETPRLTQGGDGRLFLVFRSSRDGAPQGGWPPYGTYGLRGIGVGCPGNPIWSYPAQSIGRGLPLAWADDYSPTIAAGAGGRIHYAWWNQIAGNDVAYRFLDPSYAGLGPLQQLGGLGIGHRQAESTNAEAGNLGLAEDNAGGVHVLFTMSTAKTASVSYGQLMYRQSANGGNTFAATERIGASSTAAMPKLLYGRGRVHAVWSDFRNTGGGEIYASYRDLGQTDLVDHLFMAILNRSADATTRAGWQSELARLQAIGIDAHEVLIMQSGALFNSAEYAARGRSNAQYVADLYLAFFNRAADAGGAGFWTSQLDGGAPRDMVRHAFAYSGEHAQLVRSRWSDTTGRPEDYFASDLYRVVLNRLGESANIGYWRARLRAAQCTSQAAVTAEADGAAASFFASAEYAQRGRNNVEYMQDLYLLTMRRYATLYELWSWANALNNGQATRSGVRQMFTASLEFSYRTSAIMQAGCLR